MAIGSMRSNMLVSLVNRAEMRSLSDFSRARWGSILPRGRDLDQLSEQGNTQRVCRPC